MHIFRVCFSHALTTTNFKLACGILCWRNPKRGKKWTRSFWAPFLLKRLFWKKKDWELFAHLSRLFFPCAHNYKFPACMWNFKLKEPKKGKKMNTQLLGGPSQFQQPPIEPVEQTCAMFVLWFLRPMAPLFQQPVPKAGCMQEIIFGRAMNRLLQKKRHVNSLISSFSFGSFGPWLPMLTACSKSRVHAGNQPWAGHKQVFAKKNVDCQEQALWSLEYKKSMSTHWFQASLLVPSAPGSPCWPPVPKAGCMQETSLGRAINRFLQKKMPTSQEQALWSLEHKKKMSTHWF